MSRANRINKALNQKMFLVKIEQLDVMETEIPYIKFHILGTLGYVYEGFVMTPKYSVIVKMQKNINTFVNMYILYFIE